MNVLFHIFTQVVIYLLGMFLLFWIGAGIGAFIVNALYWVS